MCINTKYLCNKCIIMLHMPKSAQNRAKTGYFIVRYYKKGIISW